MKCIQSIKETKNVELGTIKRVEDVDAETSVKSGYWKYVPKSEWKKQNKPQMVENVGDTKKEKKSTKKTKK